MKFGEICSFGVLLFFGLGESAPTDDYNCGRDCQNIYGIAEVSTDNVPLFKLSPAIHRNESCTCICALEDEPCLCLSFETNSVYDAQCYEDFDKIIVNSSSRYSVNNSTLSLHDLIFEHPELKYFNTDLLSDGIFGFAADFYKSYLSLQRGSSDNLVFSPLSMHVVLSVLTSASTTDSETQMELLNALGKLNNIRSLERLYKSLLTDYAKMSENLIIANGIWSPNYFRQGVNASFINDVGDIYKTTYDFVNPNEAKDVINDWVDENTRGKIPKLFDFLSSEFTIVMANVVYFKDSWTIPFEEAYEEKDKFFTLQSGRKVSASMVERSSHEFQSAVFSFGRINNIQVVTIPYQGFESRFEMVLIVPEGHKGLSYLENEIRFSRDNAIENVFQTAMKALPEDDYNFQSPTVIMPEILIKTKLDVKETLKEMGVESIFRSASLDKIGFGLDLKVDQMKHEAIIEVNRQGTEGAAATGIEIVPLSGLFGDPMEIKANRPFLFFIHDKRQKIPIFMGRVTDPNSQ